jgi:hypothetical protein
VLAFKRFVGRVVVATALTAIVGELLIKTIETTVLHDVPNAEIEVLFSHLEFIAPANERFFSTEFAVSNSLYFFRRL